MTEPLVWDFRPLRDAIEALGKRVDEQPAPSDPEARLAQLEADVNDLKAIVQQHWDAIQRAAKKGDGVTVTGKVSAQDVARSRTVTWAGKVL